MSDISVEYIDSMGDDNSVVNAARVSFAKDASNYTDEQNAGLIAFLARERHDLPFTHTAITLRVKAPIFVARQCYKSKIGFVENEVSRRYVTDDVSFFMPDEWREAAKDKKQGSGGKHVNSDQCGDDYERICRMIVLQYKDMIWSGIAPEQARMILPQSMMTEWIWTGSLLAYARFWGLRSKPDTQMETRIIAEKVGEIMNRLYPTSWAGLTAR